MDTTQIRQLVAAKIAGQGTNVDAGSALPDIINGLCDVIDNLPEPQTLPFVEITEELGDTPIEISEDRAGRIINSAILRYSNFAFVLINPKGIYGFSDLRAEASLYSVWTSYLTLDDGSDPAGYEVIALYREDDKFYLKLGEL